jgi:hypothetical protein
VVVTEVVVEFEVLIVVVMSLPIFDPIRRIRFGAFDGVAPALPKMIEARTWGVLVLAGRAMGQGSVGDDEGVGDSGTAASGGASRRSPRRSARRTAWVSGTVSASGSPAAFWPT